MLHARCCIRSAPVKVTRKMVRPFSRRRTLDYNFLSEGRFMLQAFSKGTAAHSREGVLEPVEKPALRNIRIIELLKEQEEVKRRMSTRQVGNATTKDP